MVWEEFETLIRLVTASAFKSQNRDNADYYRFLIFAGLVAYSGLPVAYMLDYQWANYKPYLRPGKTPGGTHEVTKDNGGKVEIEIVQPLKDIICNAYKLACGTYGYLEGDTNLSYVDRWIMPSVDNDGGDKLRIQSLNKILKKVAFAHGTRAKNVTGMTFRKTYARHQYDILGHNVEALKKLRIKLKHNTLSYTAKYIALPGEVIPIK